MSTLARIVLLPVADGPSDVHDLDIPDLEPKQVVVKQFASDFCHSHLHQMHWPRGALYNAPATVHKISVCAGAAIERRCVQAVLPQWESIGVAQTSGVSFPLRNLARQTIAPIGNDVRGWLSHTWENR